MYLKKYFTAIICVFIFGIAYSQPKDSILIAGITYHIDTTVYSINTRVDPPVRLKNGHWIGYYSDSTIAFKGFFSGESPQGEFCIYEENRIYEVFYFKNGQVISSKEYWWLSTSSKTGKYKWGLRNVLTVDSLQNSLIAEYFNYKGKMISKNVYEYSEDAFGSPFIREYEGTEEYLRETYLYTYSKFGKLKKIEKKIL